MYYYPDLIVSNLFYCTCTIRADVSAPCACLSCSLAFLLLYVVFLSKYMMMMIMMISKSIGELFEKMNFQIGLVGQALKSDIKGQSVPDCIVKLVSQIL